MKQLIIQLLTGKPMKGEPVNWNHTIKSTVVPFDLKYETWQWSIEMHGYENAIEFFQRIYK